MDNLLGYRGTLRFFAILPLLFLPLISDLLLFDTFFFNWKECAVLVFIKRNAFRAEYIMTFSYFYLSECIMKYLLLFKLIEVHYKQEIWGKEVEYVERGRRGARLPGQQGYWIWALCFGGWIAQGQGCSSIYSARV